ncbi:MAG: hypothetical protein ACRDTD_10180, partial [Pseudonocardiaceae bacterium]
GGGRILHRQFLGIHASSVANRSPQRPTSPATVGDGRCRPARPALAHGGSPGRVNLGRCAPRVHKKIGSGRSILRMSGGPGPDPGGKSGGDSSAARASLAGLSPSRLPAWLPGVFAARLLRGVRLPSGQIVGETDRVVHLFPIPSGRVIPEQLRAYCGLVIQPGEAGVGPGRYGNALRGVCGGRAGPLSPPDPRSSAR